MDKENFLGVLIENTEEQQQALGKGLKDFELHNTRLEAAIALLERTMQKSERRQLIRALLVCVSIAAVLVIGVFGVIEWKRYEIESLIAERDRLTAELESLTADIAKNDKSKSNAKKR